MLSQQQASAELSKFQVDPSSFEWSRTASRAVGRASQQAKMHLTRNGALIAVALSSDGTDKLHIIDTDDLQVSIVVILVLFGS